MFIKFKVIVVISVWFVICYPYFYFFQKYIYFAFQITVKTPFLKPFFNGVFLRFVEQRLHTTFCSLAKWRILKHLLSI